MQLARVKGTVVSTNKAEKLNGLKLQLIKPIDIETWQEKGGLLVAIDVSFCLFGKLRQVFLLE